MKTNVMENIKRERNEFQSGGAETHHQNGFDLGVFEVQIMRCLIKNALWLYAELCLPFQRGAHFQKFHEKKCSEDEKWSRKTLDGKGDGYSWGLSGAEKRKC